MNTNTNELFDVNQMTEKEINSQMHKLTEVPEELQHAANVKLNGEKSAIVSKTSGGKLSKFAAKERLRKKKLNRKNQKKNRKINR
jgi:hypothetical protein